MHTHTQNPSLHTQNSTSGAEMLTPVCLPAGVAGVALFSIFIAILNLYLTPLLPSSAVLLSLSLRFFLNRLLTRKQGCKGGRC